MAQAPDDREAPPSPKRIKLDKPLLPNPALPFPPIAPFLFFGGTGPTRLPKSIASLIDLGFLPPDETLMREEGLERTDNGLKQTSWPEATPINQKNYYTEFGKRDDQLLASRLQNEANQEKLIRDAKNKDRALARTGNADVPLPMDEDESERLRCYR
ncbi:hypothetical protein DID88_009851 [Monilinia fructigena]|uniref:Uncharacterized protein n=1 Tax=Monilinia fructigena TaxID=38457 RepID=A0A395IKQ9_9HELO|nr:hypothetical protein DID88_009851 [Monilinia fructigena]